jgi:hypothetical protein
MELSNHRGHIKVAGGWSLAGAVLAMAVSNRVPPRYVSSAVVRITPEVADGKTVAPEALQREAAEQIEELKVGAGGRDNLLRMVQLPGLDLYPTEREELPLEDVAEQMHDDGGIQLVPVQLPDQKGTAFRISFAY